MLLWTVLPKINVSCGRHALGASRHIPQPKDAETVASRGCPISESKGLHWRSACVQTTSPRNRNSVMHQRCMLLDFRHTECLLLFAKCEDIEIQRGASFSADSSALCLTCC